MVGQDTRLPAFVGPGPLALRSGLHRVGPARRVGVAARRQLRVAGLGWSGSARLLHPGDAEQAQGEAQRDAHSHRPRRPQHGQQQRRPHGVPTAGPRPPRSPRRLRGGGTGEGADPEGPSPAGGPAPSPPSRDSSSSPEPPGRSAALRAAPRARASQAAAVRRVTERAPPPRWGLSRQLPEREEGRRLKGRTPGSAPSSAPERQTPGAESPVSPCVVGASRMTSEAARPCQDGAP